MLRNYPESRDLAREILICEQEGDRLTHDLIQRMNQTFVTPIDREDITALASGLDDVVDFTEEVADCLGLYKIEAPMEQSQRLAHVLLEASRQIELAVPKLRNFGDISARVHARSTASRTRATASSARPSPPCSRPASTRWS